MRASVQVQWEVSKHCIDLTGWFFFFLLPPGQAQHPTVLPRLRLAQVCVRRHHVGVHSDRRQLHGGPVCPTRRGILPKVLQVHVLVRLARFSLFLNQRAVAVANFQNRGEVGGSVISAVQ